MLNVSLLDIFAREERFAAGQASVSRTLLRAAHPRPGHHPKLTNGTRGDIREEDPARSLLESYSAN